MRIAVFGAGALGGYFGARLSQAGHEVSFVARGAHLEALRRHGLRVESALGDVHLPEPRASDSPAALDAADIVLFLVKLYDTDAAARALEPLLHEDTVVLSLQNGVDAWQRIADVVGERRVMGGSAYIFADVKAPGVIRHSGRVARLVFGEFDGRKSARAQAFAAALRSADIAHELVDDVWVRVWEKFVLLSALSGVTTLTRLPIGAVLADPLCRSLFVDALNEAARVGRTRCPGLADDIAERQLHFATELPYGMHASMLDDLERGKRLELDDLSGAVARIGGREGVPTPVHDMIRRALHPYVGGRALADTDGRSG